MPLFRKTKSINVPSIGVLVEDKKRFWKVDTTFGVLAVTLVCHLKSDPDSKGADLRPLEEELQMLRSFLENKQKIEHSAEVFLYGEYNRYRKVNTGSNTVNPFTGEVGGDEKIFPKLASSSEVWSRVIFTGLSFSPGERINEIDFDMEISYRFDWDFEHLYAMLLKDSGVVGMVDC